MFKRRFRLPSPALVLSMLALALALGGTAFAAGAASTGTRHGDARQDKKLILKLAKSLTVKHARTAGSARTAKNAVNAVDAVNAVNAVNAGDASHATSADSATNATNATNATSATHATSADSATNATNADNADTVGGYAPNGLTRVAYAQGSTTISDTDGAAVLETVSLTAPSAGFVLVQATADIEGAGSGVTAFETAVVDPATATQSYWDDGPIVASGVVGGVGESTSSAVFAVTAGVQTFHVDGQVIGTGSAPSFVDATASFIPFGSTGGSTLSSPARTGTHMVQPAHP